MSLREKTISGSVWQVGFSITGQIIQLCITAIMARLLFPKDFGLFGMALVFIAFLQVFSQLGFGVALVQKKDLTEEHLSSIFWINIATGISLCLIYMASANLIALFFHEPGLKKIIYLLSIGFIIVPFSSVQSSILTREMRFNKLALINIGTLVFSGLLGILLAINNFGVWSLVWARLGQIILAAILLFVTTAWKPKLIFCWRKVKELTNFSANVLGFDIVSCFSRNIQNILIGRFMNPAALGYYSMANNIMLLPLQHVSWKLSSVLFPALSKIQSDLSAVRDAYFKIILCISIITFPVMLGLLITAPELIVTIVGEKWRPVIVLVQILSISGLLQSIAATTGSIMLSQGRADLQFKWGLFASSIKCLAIFLGLRWGIMGVAILYTSSTIFLTPILMVIALKLIKLDIKEFLRSLMPAMVSSLMMLVGLIIIRHAITLTKIVSPMALLLSLVFCGVLIYLFSLRVFFSREFREILEVIKNILPSLKRAHDAG